ncbi:hypothetical protein FRC09_016750 [Ceratobasidium sp. 395]|nr:hypothetical protein FRC09_016750 [Ceratobasidium sp. 395]
MPDPPQNSSQAAATSQGSAQPRRATRRHYSARPRKNETETADSQTMPDQPVTPAPEPPKPAQPVVSAPKPNAPTVATVEPQPPKERRGGHRLGAKSKRSGKQTTEDRSEVVSPATGTPQNSTPPSPMVSVLSVQAPATSDAPTRGSRSSRSSRRGHGGRGGRTDPPGGNRRDAGKDKEVVYDRDVAKVVEDDTSSSCDSSILTPINSPASSVSTYNQRSSKTHRGTPSTSKATRKPALETPKPVVREVDLDTWADNTASDVWAMDVANLPVYSTPPVTNARVNTPILPSRPSSEVNLNTWADNTVSDVWAADAPNTPIYSTSPVTNTHVNTPALPNRPPREVNLQMWADTTDSGAWATNTRNTPDYSAPPAANIRTIAPTPPNRPPPMTRAPVDRPPPSTPPTPAISNQPPPIQPPIDESPTSIRRVGLAHVLLGPGACVQHVFTDAESPWIVISNLPRGTRRHHIQDLVAPFGETRYMKVYEPKSDTQYLPTARVLFDRHESAKEAVGVLQGQTMRGKRIIVRLDTDASGARLDGGFVRGLNEAGAGSAANPEGGAQSSLIEHDPAAVLRSCTVKVTWYAPSASVYITYREHRFAMERVKELTGRSFGNRRVQMKPLYSERDDLARVMRENGGYVVRMDGLWANPDLESLGRFVRSSDLVVQPNYSSEAGLVKLRQDLSDIAPLESFKLLHTRREDKKYHAIAQYTTPAAAAAAVKVFEGRRGEYLGNSPVWVSRHLTIKYSIPVKLTAALQGELNKLHSWSMDDPDLHVRQKDDIHKPGYVQISISGNETKHIASAKAQLDRALAGEPLRDLQGNKVWDAYFLSEEWAAFSENVAEQTGVCVRADQRTCSLILFGPDYACEEAGVLMRNELARLASLRRVLPIPPPVFRRLNGGGLTILRNLVGKGNIYVNFFQQSLTFYGDDEVVRRVKKALDVMYSEVGARLRRHSDCVVCLCQPEGSILLHCGHHYCRSCFSQYVASAAENRTLPIVCVGRDCKAPIPLSMITLHASQSDQDALFYAAFQSHVAAHPEQYRYCPTPDCQYVYRVGQPDTSIQCRLCLVHICTHCHVEHHEGISCEDYLASHSESEIQKSFDRWRASNDVKNCPNCNANIEKIAGCNHMMCTVCRTHICWVCLSSFATGDEVYAHMRGKHGGIGL